MKRTVKRILSCILAAASVSAFTTFPALADYTECEYDIERVNETYNSGSAENSIDGTPALQVGGTGAFDDDTDPITDDRTYIFRFPSTGGNCDMFRNDFFLSFDFRFDTIDGKVPGIFGIERLDDGDRNNKIGPKFTYSEGQIRTETGNNKYAELGAVSPDVWYTIEMEGKMAVAGAAVEFRLYGYEDGEKQLIETTENLNLRNFSGTNNGAPNLLHAASVSMDNVKFVSTYPDEVRISGDSAELEAGQALTLDYEMYRQDKLTTKHPVMWSVYDETNTSEITDGSVTVNENGVLRANIHAEEQTVTVRATTNASEKGELTGTYTVNVKPVSTENEPFDKITINGPSEVKAGTSTTYSFTAEKLGADVTDSLEEGDVVWSVYTADDLYKNNNRYITAENGVLTVGENVVAQDIIIRASTASGAVYASYPVSIDFADSKTETVLGYSACEDDKTGFERVESWDGSYAIKTGGEAVQAITSTRDTWYTLTSLDIKFGGENSGFTLRKGTDKTNPCIRMHNGQLAVQKGSSDWDHYIDIDTETWYHMEVLYSNTQNNASMTIAPYNADGTLGETKCIYEINTRNCEPYDALQIEPNTTVDNIVVVTPKADKFELSAASTNMFAGSTNQITVNASRNGLTLKNYEDFKWSVLDSDGLPIIDGSVSISGTGLLSADAMAKEQAVTVVASEGDVIGKAVINIQSSDIFTVTNLGVNEDKTKIVRMYVEKNFYYNDSVTFIIAIYGPEGELKGVSMRSGYGDSYNIGENEVTFDFTLPADFDPSTDTISTFVWTSL